MIFSIKVGLGSCGLAAGAGEVFTAAQKYVKKQKIKTTKKQKTRKNENTKPDARISSKYTEVYPNRWTRKWVL